MQTLLDSFTKLHKIHAFVVGDFMLDIYIRGEVERISPEAPVPILRVNTQEMRSGGAGNVIMNLLSLGANVTPFGRVGDDIEGIHIRKILEEKGVNTSHIYREKGYPTPTKSRLIGDSQQLYRIDKEIISPIDSHIENKIESVLSSIISDINIIVVSDYKKGSISRNILRTIFALSKEYNVPVVIDPKGNDFLQYTGAYLIKPNLKEAYIAAHMSIESPLEEVAKILLEQSKSKYLLITRSEKGMSLFQKKGQSRRDFFVSSREVKDVTGAGDSVLAMLAVSIANHIPIENSIQLANISGALAIERVGCVSISLENIAEYILHRYLRNQRNKLAHGKLRSLEWISEEYLEIIKKSLCGYSFQIIIITSDKTSSYLEDLLSLKEKNSDYKLLIYLQGEQKQFHDFTSNYFHLYELGFIIIGGNTSLDRLKKIFGEENICFPSNSEIGKELIYQ